MPNLTLRNPVTREKVSVRKITAITDEIMCKEYNSDLPFHDEDINILKDTFDTELNWVMDVLAPVKDITLSNHLK